MTEKDGGPAFPSSVAVGPSGDLYHSAGEGMSLRDYFAGQALAGNHAAGASPAEFAEWSYMVANAMLEARHKEKNK